jgi:hypothetical protein
VCFSGAFLLHWVLQNSQLHRTVRFSLSLSIQFKIAEENQCVSLELF